MNNKKYMVPVPKLKKLIQGTGTEIIQLKKAFTLVELIVVITILAILATVGFVSFSGYLAGTRDVNRISQLKSMSDSLELYRTKKDLPIPDDKVDIKTTSKTIAYQGYIGKNVLETIEYTESGLDPKDKNYFSYYLTKNKKYFQLLSFLEEPNTDVVSLNKKVPVPSLKKGIPGTGTDEVLATDYSERYPKTTGKKLGILTGTGTDLNTPIQEILTDSLNIETTTGSYIANISSNTQISGTGSKLILLDNLGLVGGKISNSCNDILEENKEMKNKDGIYLISGSKDIFEVYCDMTTDGGGWTLISSYVNGSFFLKCNTLYGTNCSSSCGEFTNDGGSCNDNTEKAIQDSEISILKNKYIIRKKYGNLSSYMTDDYVGKSYIETPFSEVMFYDDDNDYITYDFNGEETSSMTDYYYSIKDDEMLTHLYKSKKTSFSDISTINSCNTLSIAMHEGDNDGGIINYGTRRYGNYSPAHGGPAWDSIGNSSCHYDDSNGRFSLKKLGGQLNDVSEYILWYVR